MAAMAMEMEMEMEMGSWRDSKAVEMGDQQRSAVSRRRINIVVRAHHHQILQY